MENIKESVDAQIEKNQQRLELNLQSRGITGVTGAVAAFEALKIVIESMRSKSE